MKETECVTRVVNLYDWISSERRVYLELWEKTDDEDMHTYYGEKASTYTSIKLYMEKYFSGLKKIDYYKEKKGDEL